MRKIYHLASVLLIVTFTEAQTKNVGINTNNPLTALDVNGAYSARFFTAPAANAVTIPNNVSLFRLTLIAGGPQANVLIVATPKDGQLLSIINEDDDPATFAGNPIAANNGIGNFVYVGASSAWRMESSNSPVSPFTAGTGLAWNSTTLNSVWTKTGNDIYNNNSGKVGIGNSTPSASSILDLSNATNRGFLAPSVTLSRTTLAAPVTSPATGLMVYNTGNTVASTTSNIAVAPGYYYYDGAVWQRMGAGKFSIPFKVGGISASTGNTYTVYSIEDFISITTNSLTTISNSTAANYSSYIATSNCKLDAVTVWLTSATANRTFDFELYKYHPISGVSTTLAGGVLLANNNSMTCATANAYTLFTLTLAPNTPAIVPGDILMLWSKANGATNYDFGGTMEFQSY